MEWNCCRTCLSTIALNPIFSIPSENEKFSEIIHATTGLKVELNDELPQEICTECVNFINESRRFQNKCYSTQKTLLEKLNNKQFSIIKDELSHIFKTESARAVSIDISETYDVYVHHATNTELEYDTHFDDALKTQCWRSDDIEPELQPVVTVKTRRKSKTKNATVKKKIKDKSDGTRVRKCKKAKVEDEDAEDVNNKAKLKDEDAEHVNNEEVIKDKEKKDGKEAVECEICHKILTSKLSLRNHHKIHSGFDVVCEHCGKKFITRRLLLMHCRAKHGYEKTDKCSYCDYRASNAEQVKIHERLHTGERPYVCPHCNAGFHRQSSFLQHVAIHLPEKTVQCTQCPALFKSATLMRIHANRHRQPQYSFKCYVCGSSFARRRNVARHLQRIHALAAPLRDIERVRIA